MNQKRIILSVIGVGVAAWAVLFKLSQEPVRSSPTLIPPKPAKLAHTAAPRLVETQKLVVKKRVKLRHNQASVRAPLPRQSPAVASEGFDESPDAQVLKIKEKQFKHASFEGSQFSHTKSSDQSAFQRAKDDRYIPVVGVVRNVEGGQITEFHGTIKNGNHNHATPVVYMK